MTDDSKSFVAKSIPRISRSNFQPEIIKERQDFITRETGAATTHISHMSLSPDTLKGNIENPIGVTQMPLGLAGPLRVNGEHASGDFMSQQSRRPWPQQTLGDKGLALTSKVAFWIDTGHS